MYDPSMFVPVSFEDRAGAEIIRPSKSYWQDVWARLRRDPLAVFGIAVIISVLLLAYS